MRCHGWLMPGHVHPRCASSPTGSWHTGCGGERAARCLGKQPCGAEATSRTRRRPARRHAWGSLPLPGRGRDDPVIVVLEPLPQALVRRWPDQLEAHRAQAHVDIGQLPRELARWHLDLDHGVAALLERTKHEGTALRDRRLERPEQVRGPEADVLDAFAVLLQEGTPLARLAGDRLDQLEGETRPGAPAVGDAHGEAGLRLAEVPMLESEHPLIAVHD